MARDVVGWYLRHYHDTPEDLGTARTFCDRERVGDFAVTATALAAGEPAALFRVLIAVSMFQRRQDAQIMRVLRGIPPEDARELTTATRLRQLTEASSCSHIKTNASMLAVCDLAKDPVTKRGTCGARPELDGCHLKRHTVLLKRYGHFGKVPTSIALVISEAGAADLADLHERILARYRSPRERAGALREAISRAWRVSDKIAAMFLSAVSNPDLSPGLAPWSEGIAWTGFVVVDSNVDLFLRGIGYSGPWTYDARVSFVTQLARRVPLDELKPGLHRFNPRLVQQALYVFMSVTNRRLVARDCGSIDKPPCRVCLPALRGVCPRRIQ